jgi:hypothetical protein
MSDECVACITRVVEIYHKKYVPQSNSFAEAYAVYRVIIRKDLHIIYYVLFECT